MSLKVFFVCCFHSLGYTHTHTLPHITHIHIYTHTHIYIHMHTSYIYIHIYTHRYTHTNTYMHSHIYIYIIHTYTGDSVGSYMPIFSFIRRKLCTVISMAAQTYISIQEFILFTSPLSFMFCFLEGSCSNWGKHYPIVFITISNSGEHFIKQIHTGKHYMFLLHEESKNFQSI